MFKFNFKFPSPPEDAPSIMEQIAVLKNNLFAAIVGIILGGLMAYLVFRINHGVFGGDGQGELDLTAHGITMGVFMVGGLVVSAITVWHWMHQTFHHAWKATGFVLITEGVMTFSSQLDIVYTCLAVLVFINGISGGYNIAIDAERKRLAKLEAERLVKEKEETARKRAEQRRVRAAERRAEAASKKPVRKKRPAKKTKTNSVAKIKAA